MNNSFENLELEKFYTETRQDIESMFISAEMGGTSEQFFTQIVADMLTDAGESENIRLAYDQKAIGTKKQHQINAYAISDNYETLDLFITIYKGENSIEKVSSSEIDTAFKRLTNFFRKCIYKEYVDEVEETSEVFQLAHELAKSTELRDNLVRINIVILTDGIVSADTFKEPSVTIDKYTLYSRVIDIEYLYNISEKSYIPIEINFIEDGVEIPCIESPAETPNYKAYLAIIPGEVLARMYERFGARLLEQNVRSFLQFSGKINKGIRSTIIKEPEMFLAFNNGISATANNIELTRSKISGNYIIRKISDLQIVNGGQTTASIYHTFKKDKANISNIYVQVKISVIKDKGNFGDIVGRIAEYANTQNKVSVADLSSNRPYHINFEKLSRAIFTPHSEKNKLQTRWFYERARGQYKNARAKEGINKTKQKVFDLKNPKNQVFTKEELAKYINAYEEYYEGKKLIIGPHIVVKNVRNYNQFILCHTNKSIENDNIYYEDAIAKGILYKACEKIYGVKPNAIGDLRFITVPYTIAYFGYKTKYKLDLYKIWKNQCISDALITTLRSLMVQIDSFLKNESPESLIEMWARKESCWETVKNQDFHINESAIINDLIDPNKKSSRTKVNATDLEKVIEQDKYKRLKSVTPELWQKIEDWGRTTERLSLFLQNQAFTIKGRIRSNKPISQKEMELGIKILDIVIEYNPTLLNEE